VNPKLNISEIVQCFPERVVGTHGRPVYNLTSPFDVALRENQLRIVQGRMDLGLAIPAHYFVYAIGENAEREQSRVGGLPYRPRDMKWPYDADGQPKEFVCQVDFSGSRSLLPPLPEDIMLLFASEEGSDEQPFALEWYPAGLTDLVRVADLPKTKFTFPMVQEAVHCYVYETLDYPEATTRLKGTEFESWVTLGLPCGSKIGGHQEPSNRDRNHIFTLESIRLSTDDPFPFVNLKGWSANSLRDPLASQLVYAVRRLARLPVRSRMFDVLMIGDLGRITAFRSAQDQLEVECMSH